MSLTVIDYLLKTNEDWQDSIELDDGAVSPTPLDVTGSSFLAHVRTEPDSLDIVLAASTANNMLVIAEDPTTGVVSWNVPKSVLSLIEPGVYVYDMVWTKADTSEDTVVEGTITVKRGITRT
jgi:hypothetical protein